MNVLNWHRAGPGISRAWAPALNPDAVMPPYYEIELIVPSRSYYRINLVQCKTCGGHRELIDAVKSSSTAKTRVQADYDKRIAQQSLTNPPKSA